MTKPEIIEKINDWISVAIKLGVFGIVIVFFGRIVKILKEVFFGKEGYDYREFTGAVAMLGFIGMLWNHFTDNEYEPNLYLLGACLLIIFVMSGIKEGVSIFNKFIGAKYGKDKKVSE